MRGLILRDVLSYWRRSSKSFIVTDICLFIFFMLMSARSSMSAGLAAYGYLLLCMPLGTSAIVLTMKDLDLAGSNGTQLRYFPFFDREIVLARFLAVGSIGLYHVAVMTVFCIVHGLIFSSFSAGTYVLFIAFGCQMGMIMSCVNLAAAYLGSSNASAVVYLLLIGLAIAAYLALLWMDIDIYVVLNSQILLWILMILATGAVAVLCYFLSVKAYGRRR